MKYLGEAGLQELVTKIKEYVTNAISEAEQRRHPIGSLEFNVTGANPSTYLGFGTWERWGIGRVPVGVDEEDSDFDEAEKTSGSKTHNHKEILQFTSSYSNLIGVQYTIGDTVPTDDIYTSHASSVQPSIACYMWKRTA